MTFDAKKAVQTDQAPAAIGPYNQAIVIGDLVYTSGQIALDPGSGELKDYDIATETRQVLDNLKAVLVAAGTDMPKVIKTTVFLTDLGDFGTVNTIYADYFQGVFPARSCVQVAALPKGARIEIEAIAQI